MHPVAARSSRTSLQTTIPSTTTPPSLLHPQQQRQQQILYGPIVNPMLALHPCGTGLHPSCIYPGIQRNAGLPSPVPLHVQDSRTNPSMNIGKSSRWAAKNKLVRSQQYYQQQQQQQQHIQQSTYNPKPLVLYDQTANNGTQPTPTASFLVASSTYTHGTFSGDQYNNSGIALISQPYFKPPDVQTFCLFQDRQNGQQQQEQPTHGSYYNMTAANACNLQSVNSNSIFQFPNITSYTPPANFTNNQIPSPIQTVQSAQVFSNSSGSLACNLQREKLAPSNNAIDTSAFKCAKSNISSAYNSQIAPVTSDGYSEWSSQTITSSNNLFDLKPTDDTNQETATNSREKVTSSVCSKAQEEHYSDESSASFDFTIEAEKMVSALCNTSLNDIGKEEATKGNKSNSTPLLSGAGDTLSNKTVWFTDFCTNYENATSIATQTDGPCADRTQYPELLRKVMYWGCAEAEVILNNSSKINPRFNWLKNLTTATKTAITKSSTCFPIFAGDHIFVGDLINALLRISNGWLILDNYVNKQHYPNLDDKYDRELARCFQLWEESTHELLDQIVQAFLKLEKNGNTSNLEQKSEAFATSFPGDVSLYTNSDLLDPCSNASSLRQEPNNKKNKQDSSFNSAQLSPESLQNLNIGNISQEKQSSQKESKLKSKWTVSENMTAVNSTKSVPNMLLGHTETGIQASGKLRSRANSSSAKATTSTQSPNEEFFHLRNKILTENNQDFSRQGLFKEKKQDFSEAKVQPREYSDSIFKLQQQVNENYENNYAQKCFSRVESAFVNPSVNVESVYFASNNESEHFNPNYSLCPPYTMDYGNKNVKTFDQNHENKSNMDLVYIGKSSASHMELPALPKDKMTLLSQIEPSVPDKSPEEMTANLSAWFASMRNSENRQIPFMNFGDMKTGNVIPRLPIRQEMPKNAMDLSNCIRQLQIDANRQFQTLQNMQSIQSAPWNAYNLINNRMQVQQLLEEYDSSEDVRVYMKPGSYNVPKKRHQRKPNRRLDNSIHRNMSNGSSNNHRNHYTNKEKTFSPSVSTLPRTAASSVNANSTGNVLMGIPFSAAPLVPPPTFSLQNSPRILKRSSISNYTLSQDVTWKAACASAEILLEALNVKEDSDSKNKEIGQDNATEENIESGKQDSRTNRITQMEHSEEKLQDNFGKTLKDGCGGASSYEASEDDSESTYRCSPNTSIKEVSQSSENKNGSSKTNVKTDSWLIRTLSNVNMVNKQKRRKNTNSHSSESSNSSTMEEEKITANVSLPAENLGTAAATTLKNFQQITYSKETSGGPLSSEQTVAEETAEQVAGKATYSETVRRCTPLNISHAERKEFCRKGKLNVTNASTICNTVIPIPEYRSQRKDSERSYYLLHNRSRKCAGKKGIRNSDVNEQDTEGTCVKSTNQRNDVTAENSTINLTLMSKSTIATKHGKKRENAGRIEFLDSKLSGKTNDRGWSVWYSSKRKQSLSPLTLSKLETIYQTVWQMKEADIFKCPSSTRNNIGKQSSTYTIQDYCKVIKNPMCLETVEYKLKNRVYHKVEHAVRDFRRIVHNSKLYHKDDHDRVRTIEALSKKLEELFEEHFTSFDFDNISRSPREDSPMSHRFRSSTQKLITGRYGSTKKSSSFSTTETV